MKCLILGGAGMLGHRLWLRLRSEYETWVTVRGNAQVFPAHPDFDRSRVIEHVDALNWQALLDVMGAIQPDVLINCVGLIKQHANAQDPLLALETNALLPHRLARLCQASHTRLIHISTDCVFSGSRGNYTENEISDAQDLYGRTKYLGETSASHTITLRTSIVGPELHTRHGLLAWFLGETGTVKGFTRAIYTGFSTHELADIIAQHVLPNPRLHGLYHVSSAPINKYELLHLFNTSYTKGLSIVPEEQFVCDRSLDSTRFRTATGYVPPDWPQMVARMAEESATDYYPNHAKSAI